jgi:hypothetical protein
MESRSITPGFYCRATQGLAAAGANTTVQGADNLQADREPMTTVQIVGIAVASAVVVVLVIALLITRDRGSRGADAEPSVPASGSFLDEAPQDSLAALGHAERPVEDVTHDPATERALQVAEPQDIGEAPLAPGPAVTGPAFADQPPLSSPAHSTQEAPGAAASVASAAASGPPSSHVTESGIGPAAETPAQPAEGGPAAQDQAAPESGVGGPLMPLSDIIFTTSSKLVDLQDPEVRRMLTDLVTMEMDQAEQFRRQGQIIDAVLQLTEAERISRALDLRESAQRIHTMIEELHDQM